jgi:predicted nucleotidyltransferase
MPLMGIRIPLMGMTTALGDALFGRVRQRVLGLLLGHPDRSFYTNEIIESVDAGTGAVQRELARLSEAGLVDVFQVGRQKHYQANVGAPVFHELRGIILKTSGLGDLLRSALRSVEPDIRAAFVFGSIAKGTDSAASDVDLMVISDVLTYGDLFGALDEASGQLGRRVNPRIHTSADLARRIEEQSPLVTRVLEGPKIWVIGGDADLAA